ncbi:MAG: tRNA pseudouridine(38-40) synthase TruA [Blastocatellia bacterium]|nr:tRNA pseudouridine(38-40) synthase TruA [Blastocatellia bacterium]
MNQTGRTLKLTIQYDGTNYSGWQIQPNRPTIQATISEVLSRIENRAVTLHGAGRTDSGVHALGQVASFLSERNMPCSKMLRAINGNLPLDIRIVNVEEVESSFHARFSAKQKTYLYRIVRSEVVSPFDYRYVHHSTYKLDEDEMKRAAALLIGRHDFAAFATATEKEDTVRTLRAVELEFSSDKLNIYVTGDGFLRYMVRTIVGTLLDVGRKKFSYGYIKEILESRSREAASETAPAQGLTLLKIDY